MENNLQKKPLIGITPDYNHETKRFLVHEDCVTSIRQAGGTPVMIFGEGDDISFLDGILLTGGGDIDPFYFGEEPIRQCGEVSPFRDAFEIGLSKVALKENIPIFGICRGMQVLNIAAGGNIFQDIDTQTGTTLQHKQLAPRSHPSHSLWLEKGSFLYELWQAERVAVNSYHHQAVDTLGDGFVAIAKSADGLVEAIWHEKHPFALGVQWHPEAMKLGQQQQMFDAFLEAACAYRLQKASE